MWPELIASSARLPMPGKDKILQIKIYCPIDFRPLEPQPNSITSAQWHCRQASHIANAHVGRSCIHLIWLNQYISRNVEFVMKLPYHIQG